MSAASRSAATSIRVASSVEPTSSSTGGPAATTTSRATDLRDATSDAQQHTEQTRADLGHTAQVEHDAHATAAEPVDHPALQLSCLSEGHRPRDRGHLHARAGSVEAQRERR